jgi:hypothetical protein
MSKRGSDFFEKAQVSWEMFPDDPKLAATMAFLQGYKSGYGVESLDEIGYRTAHTQFDRWWDINAPDGTEDHSATG